MNPDPGIFAYVFAVSLVAGILFGLAPALESSRGAWSSARKESAGTSSMHSRRLRNALMAVQVAISVVLMIVGSILIRSSIRALTPSFMASTLAAAFASIVGVLGLLLASMGIYSTVSFLVVIRTREMGIRLALGAKKSHVVGLMLRQSLRPVIVGLLVGVCLAVDGSYLLRGILYGLGTVDGLSFVGVSAAFLAIASLAAYLPSRRATKVNPVEALRSE